MEGRRDEFRELSDAFDSMLEQLESHVAEQQRFAANASHELRTPLAISRALLDVARKDPAPGRGELIERLHAVNQRAIDLTEALLLLSRGDRGNFTRESRRPLPRRRGSRRDAASPRRTAPDHAGRHRRGGPRPAAPPNSCCGW